MERATLTLLVLQDNDLYDTDSSSDSDTDDDDDDDGDDLLICLLLFYDHYSSSRYLE
jgi:hypothetical protein